MKDESEINLSKKSKRPDQVWNEKTNRWVKKDGAVVKQIEEKKKTEQEQEEKDKKVAKERKRERDTAKQEKEELESENKRLKSPTQSSGGFICCSVCSPFCGFSFRKS